MGERARRQAKNEENDQKNYPQESRTIIGMEKCESGMYRFVEPQRRAIFEYDGRSQWWESRRREGGKDTAKFDRNGDADEAIIKYYYEKTMKPNVQRGEFHYQGYNLPMIH